MINKITHLDFNFGNKKQRYIFYIMTTILFFLYIVPIKFDIKNFDIIQIFSNLNNYDIISSILKSLLYIFVMVFASSLSPTFINRLNSDFKYKIGRRTMLLGMITMAFYIFYSLMDKNTTNKIMFYNLIVLSGVYFSWLLIIRDLYINKYPYPENLKIKDISKKYNFGDSRIKYRSYSYPNRFITYNGLNPCLLAFFIVSSAISFLLSIKFNVKFYTICLFFIFAYILLINKKSIVSKVIQIIILLISVIFSFYMSDFSNSNRDNMFKNKEAGSGNVTYSKTRIGTTDNDLFDMYALLFRVEWPDKNTYLLPMASYNYYNSKYNSWLLSGDLRDYVKLSPSNTTVQFKKGFNLLKQDNSSNKVNLYEAKDLVYKTENKNDITEKPLNRIGQSSITLYGTFNLNNKTQSPIPMPFNSTYLAGDQLNKNSFFEYKTGSVSISGYYGYKDWTIYSDNYNDNQNVINSPVREDLIYPKEYEENVKKFIEEAGINIDDNREVKVNKIIKYFNDNYKYDLDVRLYGTNLPRTINDFLTIDKRGHCEYFATAMTFILRELGIPARYETGYSVTEKEPSEGKDNYWVRAKDAHAWAIYWNGKAWVNADATPSSDNAFSKLNQHSYFSDMIEKIRFKFNNIVINPIIYIFVSILIILILGIFIYIYKKKNKSDQVYFKDKNFDKFKKKIVRFEKIYPNVENELYMTWAIKTKDEKLIDIVKKYYERYKVNS